MRNITIKKTDKIVQIKQAVSVKNARLFFDNIKEAFRLIHYNDEILTVKVIEPRTGQGETDLEVINIFPVSVSSQSAINQALSYMGIDESIDTICDNLDIDIKELSKEFWGFDPFKRFDYHNTPVDEWKNRPSTAQETRDQSYRRNKDFWYEWQTRLETLDFPNNRANKKYYIIDGFNGNDTEFRYLVKCANYEHIEKWIKSKMNSYGFRKYEDVGSDPPNYLRMDKYGNTQLSISVEELEPFKDEDDKQDTIKHYSSIWNGVFAL